jgi:hypothetical protein
MFIPKHIKIRKSTDASPVGFFFSFFNTHAIDDLKKSFIDRLPDMEDPNDELARKTSYISPDKLEYHVEHSLSTYDPETGNPEFENITQVISLAKEMENFFRDEFFESKSLLKKKLDDLTHDKTKRKRCREIIGDIIVRKILPLLKLIENDEKYSGYVAVCKRPLEAVVKFLYRNYSEYTPDQSLHEKIREIFKQSIDDKDLLDERSFDLSVIDALSISAKKISHRIFYFHEPDIEIPNLKKLLLNPRICTLDKPVNIFGKVGAVNFALALILSNLKQSRRSLERSGLLHINRIPFLADSCDTETYRYPQSHPEDAKILEYLINFFPR